MKEKEKNGNNVAISLVCVILVLTCALVYLAIKLSDKEKQNNNSSAEKTIITEVEAKYIAKDVMPDMMKLAFNYKNKGHVYCGYYSMDGNYFSDGFVGDLGFYLPSNSFFKLDDLKQYLADRISEDLINKYFMDKSISIQKDPAYIERNGRLYCSVVPSEISNIDDKKPDDFDYTITDIADDSFKVNTKISYLEGREIDDVLSVTYESDSIVSKVGDKWIVTSFTEHTSVEN